MNNNNYNQRDRSTQREDEYIDPYYNTNNQDRGTNFNFFALKIPAIYRESSDRISLYNIFWRTLVLKTICPKMFDNDCDIALV